MNTESFLNTFATRSFRDTADMDYISARMCYRAGLIEQFHWQSLQAIEKYLKAILLYNRVKAKKIGHSLEKAINKLSELPFEINTSDVAEGLISHLDRYARFRYLESSFHIEGPKLAELDKTIWELRRYCKVVNFSKKMPNGEVKNFLESELKLIERSNDLPYHKFKLIGGHLERILKDKKNPARAPLVWKNLYFGSKKKKSVSMSIHMHSKNAPLSLHPEMLDAVLEYAYMPQDMITAYRGIAK